MNRTALGPFLWLGLGCGAQPGKREAPRPHLGVVPAPPPTAVSLSASSLPAPPPAAPTSSASAAPEVDDGPAKRALPPGFVAIAEKGETPCGPFRVERRPEPGPGMLQYVRVRGKAGNVEYEAPGRVSRFHDGSTGQSTLYADFCGDLTGDGVPEQLLASLDRCASPTRKALEKAVGTLNAPARPPQ